MFRRIWFICGFIYSTMSSYAAIDIIFDYSYDTGNYFGDEQRYIMEQVAYVFESRMGAQNFGSIIPTDYGMTSAFQPYLLFKNPSTGSLIQPVIGSTTSDGNVIGQANELIIFLGARSLGGTTLASAGETGMGAPSTYENPTAWQNAISARDTTSVFHPKAGSSQVNTDYSFYFDTDLTTHADATSSGKYDFYSTMVHEIGHVMGFAEIPYAGYSNAWKANKSGNFWTGANAKAEYNNQNIPLYSTPHWDLPTDGTPGNTGSLNPAYVNCACHPSMLPSGGINERTSFSDLDFALLKDIGYSISASPEGTNIGGTYTDPTWGGTYDIPVSMTYNDWLAGGNGGNGAGGGGGGGGGGSAAPEPAYIFTLMGGLLAFLGGRKNLGKIKTLLRIA
jgi:hypothetical protein